jgi:hypothetical protein
MAGQENMNSERATRMMEVVLDKGISSIDASHHRPP